MKWKFLLICSFVFISSNGWAAKVTVVNSGVTFSPKSITINVGDTVIFTLATDHNAVEVSKATWDANGNTPQAGGFSVGYGGGQHQFLNEGTYYYVCTPHASLGMKGIIIVNTSTHISEKTDKEPSIVIYPNPVQDHLSLVLSLSHPSEVNVNIFNMNGDKVVSFENANISVGSTEKTYLLPTGIASGSYIVAITINGITTRQKIVVIK